MDNLQLSAPGYQDRIVHISLIQQEGGLNLNMPSEIQTALANYGKEAAHRLIDHFIDGADFKGPVRTTWDNHRWVRYRSTMALLGDFLNQLAASVASPQPGDRTYLELIQRKPGEEPRSYRLIPDQIEAAPRFTRRLAELGTDIDAVMEEGHE